MLRLAPGPYSPGTSFCSPSHEKWALRRRRLGCVSQTETKGVHFKSLADAWADTSTPHGKLLLTVVGSIAEFERSLILARTSEGKKRAIERGLSASSPPTSVRNCLVACVLVRRKWRCPGRMAFPRAQFRRWVLLLGFEQQVPEPPSRQTVHLREKGTVGMGKDEFLAKEAEYREHARQLLQLASQSKDDTEHARLLRIADAWLQLAGKMRLLAQGE